MENFKPECGEVKRMPMSCYNFHWKVDLLELATLPANFQNSYEVLSPPVAIFGKDWRFSVKRSGFIEELDNGDRKAFMRLRFLPVNLDEWKDLGLDTIAQVDLTFDSGFSQWDGKSYLRGDVQGLGAAGIKFHVIYPTVQADRQEEEVIQVRWTLFIEHKKPASAQPNIGTIVGELPNRMDDLFMNGKYKDLTIKYGILSFMVHKAIIAESSSVFRAMFESGMKETQKNVIEISQKTFDGEHLVNYNVIHAMFRWIYTRTHPIVKPNEWAELIMLADFYGLGALKDICVHEIASGLDKRNVIDTILLSELLGSSLLKKSAFDFFLRNADYKRELIENGQYDRLSDKIKSEMMLEV